MTALQQRVVELNTQIAALTDANEALRRNLEEVYRDRNLLVQLAAQLYSDLGGLVLTWTDPIEGPGWPVLALKLPSGQVSWHLPAEGLLTTLATVVDPTEYDGHTTEE